MKGKTLLLVFLGGLLGAAVTKTERQISPSAHLLVGSAVGATIGGLIANISSR